MLKNAQRAAVQASLTDTIIRAVYQGLYQNALSAPPSDNTNTSNQRARATIAQNAAFVYYLDRKYDASWNPIPLSAAEKDVLLTKCLGLLENINTTVEQITLFQPDAYTNWQWRSKMVIHFMCAYDLLKGAGVPDPLLQNARNKLIEYARNLYREANRSVLGLTFFDVVKNNHTLMTTCALGVAAVVLNDHASGDPNAQPANWLQCALWHTDNVLWRDPSRNSEPDTIAGYAEGTYYAKYWLLNGLPFFRGMGHFAPDMYFTATYKGNSRSIRNPWYDPAYENIYEWIARTRLPDGKMPPLEDSYWNRPLLELALTGKPELHWKIYNGIIGSAAHYNATLNDVFDLRAHYVAANTPLQTQENRNLFQALPVSGNLVFRSSWGPEAIYMHVNGQNGLMRQSAGGHGQADASSFLCYAYGQHLALDAGYLSYAQRNKVMNADNHNIILVNGTCGPSPGSVGVTGDVDAYVEKALDTPRLDYGKVTTAYCNTQIARHFLFIDNRYFLQSDFISSPSAQSFTWQLHGNGLENGNASSGIFLRDFANSQATWQKQGVSLLAHITAQNQLTQIDTTSKPHELDYNNPINHTVLLATKTGEKNTLFMAGLYPYKNQTPPLITNLNGLPVGLTGMQTINNGKKEQFYAQLNSNDRSLPPALTSLGDTAFLNGQLTFISYSLEGQFLQAFVQNGSRLRVGSQKWMQSQKNLDMALQKLTDSTYYAYASQKDTLHFFIPQPVRLVQGANILAWNYDCLGQMLSVTLNGGGAFTIFIGSPSLSAPPGPTEICAGLPLILEAPVSTGITYIWESPLGQRLEGNVLNIPQASPEQTGNWKLRALQNQCVIAEFNVSISIKPSPRLSDLPNAISLCLGADLTLSALGEELTDYTWFSPVLETLSGATFRLENITPAAAGSWKLQSERAGCLTEQTFQLIIESAPEPPQVFSNAPVCQGAVLQFTSQTLSGAVYIWKGPAGITADLPNLSLLAGLEHNGNWSLTVLHNQCTLLTHNFPVEVYPLPLPSTLAPRLTLCPQSALHLPSAQEAGTVYTWQGPGNFVSTESILAISAIEEDNAGMWRLKANKNGCQREQTFEVEVVRLPRPPQLTAPAFLCQGEALALGLSPLPEAIYQWRGPNGLESDQAALNLVASPSLHSGAWTAQVTYQGCVVFDTLFILSVSPLPQASALESVYSLCPGARWKLQTAQESGAGYIFTGPNGFTYQGNVLEIPTVNAANSGVYQLKTEKNGCAIRQTFSLEVKNAPQPPTFTAPSWVCFGAPFRLIAELLPGVLYQWKAPDGTLYPSPHVEIAQAETRLQGAWELLTRYQECTLATYNIPIMVRQKPQPSLLELAYTTCQGKTLSITAASETDVFYQWEGPDYFTFSGPALVLENILPQASGIWRLRAEKEGCSREQTFTVAVESPPLWPTLPAFQTICQGQDWELGFPPLPGVTYQWQGPNGFSASSSLISIPNISPSAAGVYSLRMQSAHCQAALQTTTLSVKRVSARFAGQDTVICSGENWRLAFEVEGSGPWELEVLPLGKITLGAEGQTGPIFLFYPLQSVQNATYTLVSVRDKNGCAAAASGSRKVTVAQPPANLSIEGKAALCQGDNLAFRATPNQVGVTYLWQGPGNFNASGATMNRNGLQMEDAGVYSLMAVIGSCSARIATRLVTIFPNPEVTIQSAPPAALCLPAQPTLGLRLSGAAPWQFSYIENGQAKGPFSLSGLAIQLPLRAEAGSYTLSDFQLVDSRGCLAQIAIAPINYTLYPPMLLTVESVAAASCGNSGGEVTLRATGGPGSAYEYELQPTGISSATGRFTGLGAHTYIATARSGACQAQATFTVAADAPPYGLTISPVNGLAFAQWQEVTGSRAYKIRYREVGGNDFYQEVSLIQINSVSLRGLTPGKTYEIQVQALCADGTPTAWSSAQIYTSPNTCPLVSALQITPFSPTGANVQWPMVLMGAVCYALSFGKIDTDPNLWQQVVIPYSRNTYLLNGLEPGQRYGVRIRTNCQLCSSVSGVFSPWSEVSVFTTPFRQGLATAGPALRLWPNPLRGGFWLSWGGEEVTGLSITLFDAQGKAAFRAQESDFEAAAGATEIWIPLSDLVPGLYTAQISLRGEFRFTEKIIIAP